MKKKLIEVALPLEAINKASAREKSIRHGHPSTLHLWWARRPLAAARAVIFAQMVDDPSADPERFPTEEAQQRERERLFRLIEALVQWENTTNEAVLEQARAEIRASWQRTCAANAHHPRAKELFDPERLPAFHDPFAGGGSLPLEAQRLGLEAYASDLNPVAVLINKAMIEIPPKFAGRPPVNPESRKQRIGNRDALPGVDGLAEGHGGGEGGVPAGAAIAAGGNLRHAVATHARSGIGPGEHRGGLDAGIGQGEGPVSGNRTGLTRRDGNVSDPMRGDGLVPESGNPSFAGAVERSRENADDTPSQVPQPPLTPTSYSLSPTSYPLFSSSYTGAQGLAEDVRYYGKWMRDEAEKRIGHLYPKIEVTAEMAKARPDLKPYVGQKLTVIAWIWARTVKSPNPAFAHVDVPLASTFMLSTKPGKEAYVEVVISDQEIGNSPGAASPDPNSYLLTANSYFLTANSSPYRFTVKVGKPPEAAKNGTKLARGANFRCVMSGAPIASEHIYAEANAGRMGARLMAIVAEGERGRVYLSPTPEHEAVARQAMPEWKPDVAMPENPRWFSPPLYGLKTYGDLFTPRQLVALTTFSDLVGEAMERVKRDAEIAFRIQDLENSERRSNSYFLDTTPLSQGGTGATAYAEAVGVYLGIALSRLTDICNALCRWEVTKTQVRNLFGRQAIPMLWDFAENNVFGEAAGDYLVSLGNMVKALEQMPSKGAGLALHGNAQNQSISADKVVSTDPPYYDNIGYADLSDFFYVWLRRSLRPVFPDLFATLAVPKAEELVATPYRHGSKEAAERFFLDGMTRAMQRLAEQAHPAFPVTIYYAFKQSESESDSGTASTGWETFLDAVIRAGFAISGTWPMRTELGNRMIGKDTNALASSIVLVCRPRAANAPIATRREFVSALKAELPQALVHLQRGNIAPVDLAQAAIGPGMAVFTRYSKVLDAEGRPLTVREALALINQVLDETLAEQEGDFDADSRFAIAWFEQHGFAEGEFGVANVLAQAKNTGMNGLVDAGIVDAKRGKVRLLAPNELPADWNPATDARFTHWEAVHHLIRALEAGGETAAAELVARLGTRAETARELAYRLYTVCERKKRAAEALQYNALVQSWPEIARLAQDSAAATPAQSELGI